MGDTTETKKTMRIVTLFSLIFGVLSDGKVCGLKKNTVNAMYIEYDMVNAGGKVGGKRLRKYPKKGKSLKISVCGYVQGPAKNICAPFTLPESNACEDPKNPTGIKGRNCKGKGARVPKKPAQLAEKHILKVEMPISQYYPSVKVLAKWQVLDPSNRAAPPLFCMLVPLA